MKNLIKLFSKKNSNSIKERFNEMDKTLDGLDSLYNETLEELITQTAKVAKLAVYVEIMEELTRELKKEPDNDSVQRLSSFVTCGYNKTWTEL